MVGRIEDIAVAREEQQRGIGTEILCVLDSLAKRKGVYKNVLNCSSKNERYYMNRGYKKQGCMMTKAFF